MKIYCYARISMTETLGPNLRYGLWVQGCHKRCKGCMSQSSLSFAGGEPVSIDFLAADIMNIPNIEGITISGGEPFEQAKALAELVIAIRKHRDIGVIVYTGYLYHELESKDNCIEFLKQIDLLIDGPYVASLDDGKSLRGSSNQKVIDISGRYSQYLETHYGVSGRNSEIRFYNEEIMIVGIAGKKSLETWRSLAENKNK
jgi:anaerobic ribonucleoside-triphosphate reductase activating protein